MPRVENPTLNSTHQLPLPVERKGCLNRFKQAFNNAVLKHLPELGFVKSLKNRISHFLPVVFRSVEPSQESIERVATLPVDIFNHMLSYLGDSGVLNPKTVLYTRLCFAKKLEESGASIHKEDFIRDPGFWKRYFKDKRDFRGRTYLHAAASEGFGSRPRRSNGLARDLLKKGMDIEAVDNRNRTPLHEASEEGDVQMIQNLLEAKANIEAVDEGNRTPLYVAAMRSKIQAVKVLLEARANVDVRDLSGESLAWTLRRRGLIKLSHFLLDAGAPAR